MISSVARKRTFAELRRNGVGVRHGAVRMRYLDSGADHPELAFAIGRSFGSAVERNRGRRRLRSAFVDAWRSPDRHEGPNGAYLLTGTRRLLDAPYPQLVDDVDRCLARLGSP